MKTNRTYRPTLALLILGAITTSLVFSGRLAAQEAVTPSGIPQIQPIYTTPIPVTGFTVEKFEANSHIQAPSISKPNPIRPESIGVDAIAVPNFDIRPITPSASFNFTRTGPTRSPTAFTKNSFEYNRYNRFGGNSKVESNPAQNPRQIRPQQGERVQKVQSIVPSLDGYDVVQGYSFNPPDFNRDSDWVWLPITSR